ncbi:MAG: hypothetical protein BGO86_11010 [Chryseobacterium sp. 36-9]|nr:MAG: hypothetical protein BGO86_11010 [Chryseobacterium sp. 36-9]
MKKIFTILSIAAVSLVSAQNLLVNPGFETWTDTTTKPDGWNAVAGGSLETGIKHSGNNSIKLIPVATTTNASISAVDVAAQANTVYTVGYWVLDNVANSRGRHWVQFRNDTANISVTNSPFQPATYTSDSPQWVFVSATATSPAGTTKLRFDYRVYSQNNIITDAVYLDDVVLVQGTLAVADIKDFDKQVQFNTIVKDQITFKLPVKSTVNIYTVDGKLVSSNRVENGGSVNTQSLVKGAYIVTVDNGANKINRKVIKN